MRFTSAGSVSVTYLPYLSGITGDPLAGDRTANRQPPAYVVRGGSQRLPPQAIGSNVAFRNSLAQATSQAINSWLPSSANKREE